MSLPKKQAGNVERYVYLKAFQLPYITTIFHISTVPPNLIPTINLKSIRPCRCINILSNISFLAEKENAIIN